MFLLRWNSSSISVEGSRNNFLSLEVTDVLEALVELGVVSVVDAIEVEESVVEFGVTVGEVVVAE